jgi:hypothetical protein
MLSVTPSWQPHTYNSYFDFEEYIKKLKGKMAIVKDDELINE